MIVILLSQQSTAGPTQRTTALPDQSTTSQTSPPHRTEQPKTTASPSPSSETTVTLKIWEKHLFEHNSL